MARSYTVSFSAVAVTAAQDLFEVVAAAGKPLEICAVHLSQLTETGDAAEEGLGLLFERGHSASGSGGSAFTPVPLNSTDTAAGFSAEVNNTTNAATGTIVTLHADNWNIRIPYIWMPTPDCRIHVAGGERFVVELLTAPADSVTMSGTIVVIEHG